MTTLTILIPDSETKALKDLVRKMKGKVVSSKSDARTTSALKGLETGLKQVRDISDGKAQGYSISEIINGE